MAKKFNFAEMDNNLNDILNSPEEKKSDPKKVAKKEENEPKKSVKKPAVKEEINKVEESSTVSVNSTHNNVSAEPVVAEAPVKAPEPVAATAPEADNILTPVKKERRSVRKILLMKPSLHDKIRKSAEEFGLSENEVINQLLEHYFNV